MKTRLSLEKLPPEVSAIVDRACASRKPVVLEEFGRPVAVVLSAQEYARLRDARRIWVMRESVPPEPPPIRRPNPPGERKVRLIPQPDQPQ